MSTQAAKSMRCGHSGRVSTDKQFPPQEEVSRASTRARGDRRANNRRLTFSESETSFAVPIAGRALDAHETATTRDGAVLKVSPRGLPQGCTVDDVIGFPEEAARWLGVKPGWLIERQDTFPGVIKESERVKFFHPRTYLDKRLRRFAP